LFFLNPSPHAAGNIKNTNNYTSVFYSKQQHWQVTSGALFTCRFSNHRLTAVAQVLNNVSWNYTCQESKSRNPEREMLNASRGLIGREPIWGVSSLHPQDTGIFQLLIAF